MKPTRGVCVRCEKVRILAADLLVEAMLMTGGGAAHCLSFRHALCGHCFRLLTKHGQPMVNLASPGIQKRTTIKQEEAKERARKRSERKRLQEEINWEWSE